MKLERISILTGARHIREVNVTPEQLGRRTRGEPIQNICPELSADDREFIISGITPEEWKDTFGDASEGNDD